MKMADKAETGIDEQRGSLPDVVFHLLFDPQLYNHEYLPTPLHRARAWEIE